MQSLPICTRRKFISEQKYEQFVQLCTDKEGSASDICRVASKRSSASSLARKHEMIALRWKQKKLSLELERAPAVARMELLKLKEGMSTSASSRSKRKKQLQQCATATNLSEGEPCCSKDVTKDFLSFPLGNAIGTRAATTTSQPVSSKVGLADAKPNLKQKTLSQSNVCLSIETKLCPPRIQM